jgi:hypothetical protein
LENLKEGTIGGVDYVGYYYMLTMQNKRQKFPLGDFLTKAEFYGTEFPMSALFCAEERVRHYSFLQIIPGTLKL